MSAFELSVTRKQEFLQAYQLLPARILYIKGVYFGPKKYRLSAGLYDTIVEGKLVLNSKYVLIEKEVFNTFLTLACFFQL